MQLKIGTKKFEMRNYYKTYGDKPSYIFNLNAKYDDVIEQIKAGQELYIINQLANGKAETVKINGLCTEFVSLKNIGNVTCELEMRTPTRDEVLNEIIEDAKSKGYTIPNLFKVKLNQVNGGTIVNEVVEGTQVK